MIFFYRNINIPKEKINVVQKLKDIGYVYDEVDGEIYTITVPEPAVFAIQKILTNPTREPPEKNRKKSNMPCPNVKECMCSKTTCTNYGKCCDFVIKHRTTDSLPYCLFPDNDGDKSNRNHYEVLKKRFEGNNEN